VLQIDDPLLSLILRFVLSNDELEQPGEGFIQGQICALKDYIAQFPDADQEETAFAWIEQHAEAYRRNWERRTVSTHASKEQCADCPMVVEGGPDQCLVHGEWLQLLEAYCRDSITTRSYIESAMALLRKHKDKLKLTARQIGQSHSHH
jgi:hypothetical protein